MFCESKKLAKKTRDKKIKVEQLALLTPEEMGGDYKDAYRQIRNYLAGQFVGATRDETLLTEVIKCLFCKIHLNHKKVFFDESDFNLIAK